MLKKRVVSIIAKTHFILSILYYLWILFDLLFPRRFLLFGFESGPTSKTIFWGTIYSIILISNYLLLLLLDKRRALKLLRILAMILPFIYIITLVVNLFKFDLSLNDVFDPSNLSLYARPRSYNPFLQ